MNHHHGTKHLTFGQRCGRTLKHLRSTPAAARKAFPETTLKAIEAAIADGEKVHNAEIRLIVEAALTPGMAYSGVSNRQRARELFAQYGVWDTEDNCGVLIYQPRLAPGRYRGRPQCGAPCQPGRMASRVPHHDHGFCQRQLPRQHPASAAATQYLAAKSFPLHRPAQ